MHGSCIHQVCLITNFLILYVPSSIKNSQAIHASLPFHEEFLRNKTGSVWPQTKLCRISDTLFWQNISCPFPWYDMFCSNGWTQKPPSHCPKIRYISLSLLVREFSNTQSYTLKKLENLCQKRMSENVHSTFLFKVTFVTVHPIKGTSFAYQ